MRPPVPPVPGHPEDDRLLELAYGEAPTSEARALRQHVDGCSRCRTLLEGIAEVRSAFRSVPTEPHRSGDWNRSSRTASRPRPGPGRDAGACASWPCSRPRPRSRWCGSCCPHPSGSRTVLPGRRPHRPTDALAQAEVPRRDAGERAPGTSSTTRRRTGRNWRARRSPVAPLAKSERSREEQARPSAGPRRSPAEGAVEARCTDGATPALPGAGGSSVGPGGRWSIGRGSDFSGAPGSATAPAEGGGVAGPAAVAGAGALSSESGATMKKRNAGARADEGSANVAAPAPASPPASVVAAAPPAQTGGADARAQQAVKIAAAPVAEAVGAEDKAASADVASTAPARSAAKPAPAMQSMRMGAGSPEKQARLAEIRKELETAKGDRRKALLLEKCEIEASLQLGPDAGPDLLHGQPRVPRDPRGEAGQRARPWLLGPAARPGGPLSQPRQSLRPGGQRQSHGILHVPRRPPSRAREEGQEPRASAPSSLQGDLFARAERRPGRSEPGPAPDLPEAPERRADHAAVVSLAGPGAPARAAPGARAPALDGGVATRR